MGRGQSTLADRAEHLDAERFVGRAAERAWASAARAPTAQERILYVFGAGGVGKSALLRAIGRDAAAAGHPVVAIDGRVVGPSLDALEHALRGARGGGTVVLLDEVDALAAVPIGLRHLVVDLLPADAVVVVAGRHRPGREWFDDGIDHLVATRQLTPLAPAEGAQLLAGHGTTDPAVVADLLAWSGGYPLALTIAARHGADEGPAGGRDRDRDLAERLIGHLAGRQLDDLDPLVVEVAAIARTVDAQMLAALLPGRPTRAALSRLRASSVTEPVGPRVALHALVRRAIAARSDEATGRRRDLVVRLADHLALRIPDDPGLVVDLAELVEDPHLRTVTLGSSTTHVADRARPDDAALALAAWGGAGSGWGDRLARWCREAPGHVTCVRARGEALAAIGVAGALDRVPRWAAATVELAPVIADAERHGTVDDALFLHDLHLGGVGTTAHDEARRVILGAIVARHGVTRRHCYFTSDAPMPADCAEAYGYHERPDLQRSDGERVLRTWTTDMGPDGIVGRLRRAIHAEQGRPDAGAPGTARRAHAVLDALRHFHDDGALARSPLAAAPAASGGDVAGRARQVRSVVLDVVDGSFGPSPADVLLRRTLQHTYLDDGGGPVPAMAQLHMSRSSLYRHLKRAREQLVATIPASPETS